MIHFQLSQKQATNKRALHTYHKAFIGPRIIFSELTSILRSHANHASLKLYHLRLLTLKYNFTYNSKKICVPHTRKYEW